MGKTLGIILIIIAVIGGYYLFSNRQSSDTSQNELEPTVEMEQSDDANMEDEDAMMGQTYTLSDIAKHSSEDDCWLVIDGKVYDVTEFIADNKHPGGDAILEGCGLDATELFETRPMGSGTSHSDTARGFLPNFEIGTLSE